MFVKLVLLYMRGLADPAVRLKLRRTASQECT